MTNGFSLSTKNEVVSHVGGDECCRRAFLAGFFRAAARNVRADGAGHKLEIPRQPLDAYDFICELLSGYEGVSITDNMTPPTISGPGVTDLLLGLKVYEDKGGKLVETEYIDEGIIGKSCCKVNYLRGVFVGGGYVSVSGGYQLQIQVNTPLISAAVENLFYDFNIHTLEIERRGKYVVYIKMCQEISDALALLGAQNAVLLLNDYFAFRHYRKQENRRNNCDLGNIGKTVTASVRQIENIRYLQRRLGSLEDLPPNLYEAAKLRMAYPDDTFDELAARIGVKKSTIKNRLLRLEDMANAFRPEGEKLRGKPRGNRWEVKRRAEAEAAARAAEEANETGNDEQ